MERLKPTIAFSGKLRILMLYILFAVTVPAMSSDYIYKYQHYDDMNGMTQWHVTKMLQDKQGFMWFSTWNGLNRFDGYTFEVYKAMNEGVEAQVNNRVDFIYEDEEEQLWWMTYDSHFYMLNKTRKVTREMRYDDLPLGFLCAGGQQRPYMGQPHRRRMELLRLRERRIGQPPDDCHQHDPYRLYRPQRADVGVHV